MADAVGISGDVMELDELHDFRYVAIWPVFEALPFIGVRDRSLAMRSGLGHYLLQILTQDSLPDGWHAAEPGDIGIFDLTASPECQATVRSAHSIAVPRQLLEKALGSRNLHGLVLKAQRPMTPLVTGYLRSLCALETPLTDRQAGAAQEALVTLLSAALKDEMPDSGHATPPVGAQLRQSIVDFMANNLYLPELSPDFLRRRFHVSRAHLYRAFAADGGVATVLRDMRLDAAYGELTQAGRVSRSITEIAYSLGFSSANQLLRSFRVRFGITPREARVAASLNGRSQATDL